MSRRAPSPRTAVAEWIGGVVPLPHLVTGEGPAYHPSLVVWADRAGMLVLKGDAVRPGDAPAALLRLLAEALQAPDVGPPRRPTRVFLEDAEVARKIEAKHGIATVVGPTPELGVLIEAMASFDAQSRKKGAIAPRPPTSSETSLDVALIEEILTFASTRFPNSGGRAQRVFDFDMAHADLHMQLFVPWFAYSYRVAGGEPLAAHFLRERGEHLQPKERAWIEQHLQARLTIWEIKEVRRDEGVTVVDLLTGERRIVSERMGSRSMRVGDGILARVAREGEVDRFHGLYPQSLPPRQTLTVVKAMADRAGWPTLPVTPERVAASEADHVLVALWLEQAAQPLQAPMPELRNTDGDVLIFIEDTYDLGARRPADVVAALVAANFERETNQDEVARFHLTKRKRASVLETVSAATILVHRDRLVVEANSRKRATAARRKIEAALGGVELRRHHRSETEPDVAHQEPKGFRKRRGLSRTWPSTGRSPVLGVNR